MLIRLFFLAAFLFLANTLLAQSFTYTYEGQTLKYVVNAANPSFCAVDRYNVAYGALIIPETATDENGKSYKVVEINDYAFGWGEYDTSAPKESGNLTSVVMPNSIMNIGNYAFFRCKNLTSVTFSNAVTSIGIYAFAECVKLKSLVMPDSINEIGRYAFHKCSSLVSVSLPNELTEISDGCFAVCTELTSISIPEKVTKIGDHAFYYCMVLEVVKMGRKVSLIEASAFDGCSELREIYCRRVSPPSLGENVFWEVNTDYCKLYVPEGCEESYRNRPLWSIFTNILGYDFSADTGVSVIEVDGAIPTYYDLRGIRVSNPSRGLYIVNGKVINIY